MIPADPAHAQTRTLKMYNTHTKENITLVFKRNGRYVNRKKAARFLRDHRTGTTHKIDMRLLDIVYEIWRKTGAKHRIHVVSGYRSPKTNRRLRRRGGYVARNSLHMAGRALDIKIPGVSGKKLRHIAMKMQRGGVGYYRSNFIHVDTGQVRAWPRMTRRQLLALFPKGNTLHLPSKGKPLRGYAAAKKRNKGRKARKIVVSRRDQSPQANAARALAARKARQAQLAQRKKATRQALKKSNETLKKNKQRALARQERLAREAKQRKAKRQQEELRQQRIAVARRKATAIEKSRRKMVLAKRQEEALRRKRHEQQRILVAEQQERRRADKARIVQMLREENENDEIVSAFLQTSAATNAPGAGERPQDVQPDEAAAGLRLKRRQEFEREAERRAAAQRAEEERQAHAVLLAIQRRNERRRLLAADAARPGGNRAVDRSAGASNAPYDLRQENEQSRRMTLARRSRPTPLPPVAIGARHSARAFGPYQPSPWPVDRQAGGRDYTSIPPAGIHAPGASSVASSQLASSGLRRGSLLESDLPAASRADSLWSSPISALIARDRQNHDGLAAISVQADPEGPLRNTARLTPSPRVVKKRMDRPQFLERFLSGKGADVPDTQTEITAEHRRYAALAREKLQGRIHKDVRSTGSIAIPAARATGSGASQVFAAPRKIVLTGRPTHPSAGKDQSRLIRSQIDNRIISMLAFNADGSPSSGLLQPDQGNIATLITPPQTLMRIEFTGSSIADRRKLKAASRFAGPAVRSVQMIGSQ